jgi:acyl dehydratase
MTDVTNHAPGRPGDVLSLRSVCLSRRESKSKPDMGIVGFRTELVNQNDELVFSFSSSLLVWKRPTDD